MLEHLVDDATVLEDMWGVYKLQILCIAVLRSHAQASDRSIVERSGEYAPCAPRRGTAGENEV